MRIVPASFRSRRLPARGWRAQLRRVALATTAIFFLLALSAGALHQHGSSSSLHRIDCQACAWVHSAAGALGHAAPSLTIQSAHHAQHAPDADRPATRVASTHDGRGPPSFPS